MNLLKRKYLRFIGLFLISSVFPIHFLIAAAKKIINPNLTNQQKTIMFNPWHDVHIGKNSPTTVTGII